MEEEISERYRLTCNKGRQIQVLSELQLVLQVVVTGCEGEGITLHSPQRLQADMDLRCSSV